MRAFVLAPAAEIRLANGHFLLIFFLFRNWIFKKKERLDYIKPLYTYVGYI